MTLATYGHGLASCGAWLEQEGVAQVEHLTGSHLDRWQDFQATVTKARTQQCYAAAVRGALRWAALQEPPLVGSTLWLRITTPRAGRLIPKPIPQRDLNRLLRALAPVPAPAPLGTRDRDWERGLRRAVRRAQRQLLERLRTRALFFVIFSSGARISEALQLERDQLQDRTATVIQKGGHEKLIVISEAADVAANDYLAARPDSCRALFIDHLHAPNRLTRYGAQDGWDRLCAEVGVRPFTNHMLRHSCATELLRQKVDSLVVAHHLGHLGLAHIQNYAEVGLDTRREMLKVLDGKIVTPNQQIKPARLTVLAGVAEHPVFRTLEQWAKLTGRDLDEERKRYEEFTRALELVERVHAEIRGSSAQP